MSRFGISSKAIPLAICLAILCILSGCPNFPDDGQHDTVATPTYTPSAGIYDSDQQVSIQCATQGATIYFTTDGTKELN